MKTHLFNYSLLATGIAAVLCINSTANAATSGLTPAVKSVQLNLGDFSYAA
jgi:hypothetical protein